MKESPVSESVSVPLISLEARFRSVMYHLLSSSEPKAAVAVILVGIDNYSYSHRFVG